MIRENRIRYYAPADYSEGKDLDNLLKAIIDRTAKNEALESRFYKDRSEHFMRINRQTKKSGRRQTS